jgi:hypothetical protein
MAPLELPGVAKVIEHPHEARSAARRWARMAREIDTPDAPPEAKEKARELRQRTQAANDWARRQEDALSAGQHAHDEHLRSEGATVTPIRGGTAQQQHGDPVKGDHNADESFVRMHARAAGHAAYQAARPRAARLGNHFLQGVSEPFGAVGEGGDLVAYGLGLTLAVLLVFNLLRAPGAISDVVDHGSGLLHRVVGLTDPITGVGGGGGGGGGRASTKK